MLDLSNVLQNVKTIAVVGVSDNPNKYGNKVFFDLLNAGYDVYPVHPSAGSINNIKRYSSLSEIPFKLDLVDIVVPSKIALDIVKEAHRLDIKYIVLQPGVESEELLSYCKVHNLNCIHSQCIMLNHN